MVAQPRSRCVQMKQCAAEPTTPVEQHGEQHRGWKAVFVMQPSLKCVLMINLQMSRVSTLVLLQHDTTHIAQSCLQSTLFHTCHN